MLTQQASEIKLPVQDSSEIKTPVIAVQVQQFATAKPKFTKKSWESGENGGQGGESGV